jgi:hypothetical protein
LTRIFGGPYRGCYFLAFTIFSLGILRDHLYQVALDEQPFYAPVHQPLVGGALFVIGSVLVLSSMWALGVTGTYLGDYFGILMDAPVTGFPFNVTGSPMYWGSTLNFLGVALYKGKVAGILLTAQVFVLYWFALKWEEYVYSLHAEIFRSKLTTISPAPSLPRFMPSASVSAPRRLAARSSKLLNVIASLSGTFNIHNSLDKFRT